MSRRRAILTAKDDSFGTTSIGAKSGLSSAAGSTDTLRAVPRDQSSPHGITEDPREKPAGQRDVHNRQKGRDRERAHRDSGTRDEFPHLFKNIGRRQQPRDHLHPFRQSAQWIEHSRKR